MTSGNDGRGFASMDDEKQREIASKGGEAVSRDREHMSAIGQKGGESRGGSGKRGGASEQHHKAGQQSHKND